jgi:hypothetical protein
MKINWFRILVLISLVFLGIYLYKEDLLLWPKIYSWGNFLLSISFLFIGFYLQTVNWRQILRGDFNISRHDAIVSTGLSVFTKYVPGKVMVILGKAEYVTQKYKYPRKEIIARSLEGQLLTIWIGTLIGSLSLTFINVAQEWVYLVFSGLLVLCIVLFNERLVGFLSSQLSRLFKRNLRIPKMKAQDLLRIVPIYILYWLSFAIGFYFLTSSLTQHPIDFQFGLIFPLAATVGILAIIAPGGLGVREGVLFFFLNSSGLLNIETATTVAVFSRLWFLIGEVALFSFALLIQKFSNSLLRH